MKRFFRTLGILLLGGAAACSQAPRDIPCNVPPGEVKLISFNIRYSGNARQDGPCRWEKRRKAVLDMLQQEGPSVMGIQEGLIDQVRYIERNCPQYTRIGVGRDDGADGGEIMAIFYRNDRFEAPESGTFWLSETPDEVSRGWDAACNRTVSWALLREKATGKSFYYLNTHFDHMGDEARRREAQQIADYIDSRIPAGAPVIVGGDLNAGIEEPLFDPLKSRMLVARDIAEPTDRGGTFNGFGSTPGNIVLDHIFCRDIDTLAGAPSLRTLREGYGAPYLSDHYPVVFTFRLP